MASKRFHITPDGPKKCTATFRACPYASHYDSEESAHSAQYLLQQADSHEKQVADLQNEIRNKNSNNTVFVDARLNNRTDYTRTIGNRFKDFVQTHDKSPKFVDSMIVVPIDCGGNNPITIRLNRLNDFDKDTLQMYGDYEINVQKDNDIIGNRRNTPHYMKLKFNNEQSIRRSFSQIREIFYNAAVDSGARTGAYAELYDDPIADSIADEKVEEFRRVFNVIEGYGRGEYAMWEMGQGEFAKSDYNNIIVDVDYRKSGFSWASFRNFMRSDLYAGRTPNVNVRVTERNDRNETEWTLAREGDVWHLHDSRENGRKFDVICADEKEAYDAVFWASMNSVNKDDEEAAHERGIFAHDLVWAVKTETERNNKRVLESAEEERRVTERLEKSKINEDIYGLSKEKNGSMMSKIFDTFT